MGVLASMHTGISGLQASGTNLGIIGDNIANAATTGFKASRGEFQDVISTNLKGILGGNQIGRGVKLNAVTSIFQQGTLTPSERDSDMAIRGDGFYVVKNAASGAVSYTRDGSFRFDDKGRLQTADGQRIQGYSIEAESGKVSADLNDVQFTTNTIPAKGSAVLRVDANFDSRVPLNLKPYSVADADKTADFTAATRIFDSTGTSRTLNMHFYKSNEGEWTWHASADSSVIAGGVEGGGPIEVANGKLTFTKDGKLDTDTVTMSNINFKGASPNQKIDFLFGDAITTRKGTGLVGSTQYGSKTQIFRQTQDGYTAGTLTNFSVEENGTVSGSYSNGITKPLAKIALARFENNEGLFKLGANRFKDAVNSGEPLVGSAEEGGRGSIVSKSLESSNVDLAHEFVSMIQTQRNFQANTKTISTSDEMLQDVINLKR